MPDGFATIFASLGNVWDQLAALAVAYSFSVLGALLLIVAGYTLAGYVERWTDAGLKRLSGFDETLRLFLTKLLRYAIIVLVAVSALAQFGVQTASILAALGAAGLAIGLALQGTLQNIAAGLMLLWLRPFRTGEDIVTGTNIAGTVREVGLFATRLRSPDGLYMLVPNSLLWNTPVTNSSRNRLRKAEIVVRIGAGEDADAALRELERLARADPRVLKSPAPAANIVEFGDWSIKLSLAFWTTTQDNGAAKNDLFRAARKAMREAGIAAPFPGRRPEETALLERKAAE